MNDDNAVGRVCGGGFMGLLEERHLRRKVDLSGRAQVCNGDDYTRGELIMRRRCRL